MAAATSRRDGGPVAGGGVVRGLDETRRASSSSDILPSHEPIAHAPTPRSSSPTSSSRYSTNSRASRSLSASSTTSNPPSSQQPIRRKPVSSTVAPLIARYSAALHETQLQQKSLVTTTTDLPRPDGRNSRSYSLDRPYPLDIAVAATPSFALLSGQPTKSSVKKAISGYFANRELTATFCQQISLCHEPGTRRRGSAVVAKHPKLQPCSSSNNTRQPAVAAACSPSRTGPLRHPRGQP